MNCSGCGNGDNCCCFSQNSTADCSCKNEIAEVNANLVNIASIETEIKENSDTTVELLTEIKDAVSSDECPCEEVLDKIQVNTFSGTAIASQINYFVNKISEAVCVPSGSPTNIYGELVDIDETLDDIKAILTECCNKIEPEQCALLENPIVQDGKLVYTWTNYDANLFGYGQICLVFTSSIISILPVYIQFDDTLVPVSILGIGALLGVVDVLVGIKLNAVFNASGIKIFKNQNLDLLSDLLSII